VGKINKEFPVGFSGGCPQVFLFPKAGGAGILVATKQPNRTLAHELFH
jgi:hypothetical protein